ncbi:MAG: hypothetical protein C0473_03975 [Cyanobacteria bacterium DS3.002]|nr:hypothetical protein [Cyanobacteria bacterium DS3.002]MBA4049920.1 hypothetical protein [Cyanobacteria bacterium DS2.008]MBA4077292.1 hypothetical protein [Cyanobacteria bacterium PR.023]
MKEKTDEPLIRKGHCPECGPEKSADIVGYHREQVTDEQSGVWESKDYRILKCRGCSEVYFQTSSVFSEDDHDYYYHPVTGETMCTEAEHVTHWPAAKKRKGVIDLVALQAVDQELGEMYAEACKAHDESLNRLAAAGIRATFDRGATLSGIDPAFTFEEKLEEFVKRGIIGTREKQTLSIVVDAGNAASHRSWKPADEDLDNLFFALEIFLQHLKFPYQSLETLKLSIPAKPKRQKK